MKGDLFRYSGELIAFITSPQSPNADADVECENVAVFVGGLGDTMLALPYIEPLQAALGEAGWGFVQFLMTSSGIGYGTSSIQQDSDEIDLLLSSLAAKYGVKNVLLIGHSTGCQDIIAYLKNTPLNLEMVKGIVIQGPVSDRDYMVLLPDTEDRLVLAREAVDRDEPDTLLPLTADDRTPMTAARFLSLVERGGADDMFSLDLTDEEMSQVVGHIAVPCMIAFSMADEFVPESHEKIALKLHQCIKNSALRLYGSAGHGLGDERDQNMFIQNVMQFVKNRIKTMS